MLIREGEMKGWRAVVTEVLLMAVRSRSVNQVRQPIVFARAERIIIINYEENKYVKRRVAHRRCYPTFN